MRKWLQNRLYFVICDVLFSLDNLLCLFESAQLRKIKIKVVSWFRQLVCCSHTIHKLNV